jgi:hypothetical protein
MGFFSYLSFPRKRESICVAAHRWFQQLISTVKEENRDCQQWIPASAGMTDEQLRSVERKPS